MRMRLSAFIVEYAEAAEELAEEAKRREKQAQAQINRRKARARRRR